MKRAGRRTKREIRRHRIGVARRNVRPYVVVALLLIAFAGVTMAVAGALMPAPQMFYGSGGVYATLFVAMVGYTLMLDGSHLRSMGAEAEEWTSQELCRLVGWKVIDGVEFADRDIDPVAIGPAHVLALETKWTSKPLRIEAREIKGLCCDGLSQA